jgi:hypothetical protein
MQRPVPAAFLFVRAVQCFRRDFGETRLRDYQQKNERTRRRLEMDLNTKTAKLTWLVTLLALTLATVAAQSPFF